LSELRYDPLKRRWTIISTERGLFGTVRSKGSSLDADCPFCPGNEQYTGHEIHAVRTDGRETIGLGWDVRVVPNKHPVLRVEGSLQRRGDGIYDSVSGVGAHEVIIETPDHQAAMADYPVEKLAGVLSAWRARLSDLSRDQRLRYLMLFKNHGVNSGARLEHSHSQIIGVPEIPTAIALELRSARDYFHHKERCIFCDMIRQELEDGRRIVLDAARFVAFTPFASASAFAVDLAPRFHSHKFTNIDDEGLFHLADALKNTLLRLRQALDNPSYHLSLHTAPPAHPMPGKPGFWDSLEHDWHWHIEIIPMFGHTAGMECGSEILVNSVTPEEAAKFLREVDI